MISFDHFNTIIHLYPLHLNLKSISRLEFDFICFHLQPKQVISLILSDESIPGQVELFKKYFPLFQQQFVHLQSVTLLEMFDETIDLPKSVKSLKIRKYDIYKNFGFNFDQLLEQQAKVLTHLKIDRIGLLNYINIQFPVLTHLIIDGGFNPDVDCYIEFSDQYENVDAISIFQRMGSSLTHLHLFIDKENQKMKINFQQFSHCLTHLTLHFVDDIIVSFQSFQEYFINLHQLTNLTLQANGKNDLIDGNQWKNFLSKTNIIKFNFRFQISNHYLNINQNELLESFRSSFWLKEKRWYVGYFIYEGVEKTLVYTINRFRPKYLIYPSSNFPHLTTAPTNIEQNIFYQNKIEYLEIDIDNFLLPPIHRFTQVNFLILNGSKLMSLDILQTIIDFNQIEELDVSYIKYLSRHELIKLIKYLPRLHSLTMEYHPLFVVPLQIHTLRLEGDCRLISIDNLCHTIKNIKILEIPINSKDMMMDIIDQLDHINDFLFICDDFSQGCYFEFFIKKLRISWLEENSYRLGMNHFTFRQGEEYQQIQMSIGGPKTKKYSE